MQIPSVPFVAFCSKPLDTEGERVERRRPRTAPIAPRRPAAVRCNPWNGSVRCPGTSVPTDRVSRRRGSTPPSFLTQCRPAGHSAGMGTHRICPLNTPNKRKESASIRVHLRLKNPSLNSTCARRRTWAQRRRSRGSLFATGMRCRLSLQRV